MWVGCRNVGQVREPGWIAVAVEIATDGLLGEPIGSLVKVTPGASEHETVAGGLFAPYGVAFGSGAAYVTTCSVCLGDGEVIRIPLD